MHLKEVELLNDKYPEVETYPFNLPLLRQTERINFTTPVTFFVGENGSGKSTLLEALARRCGIHIWRNQERGRCEYNVHEDKLHHFLKLRWSDGPVPGAFFASQIFHHFSQALDEWASADPGILKYFGGHSLMTLSHGQSLMAFFNSRFERQGIYLLDEPETALSPRRQIELLNLLHRLGPAGQAQFIIATHSPILLACPGARIFSFDCTKLTEVRYKELEHYCLYRDFLNRPGDYIES